MSDEHMERVRERAHALWEEAGRPHGYDAEHWSQAEHEIAAEEGAQSPAPAGTVIARRGRKPKAAVQEAVEAPKAKRGRPSNAAKAAKAAAELSADEQETSSAVEPGAVTDEDPVAPKAKRGARKPKAAVAGGEDAPKVKRGRKPKVAPEGSGTAE